MSSSVEAPRPTAQGPSSSRGYAACKLWASSADLRRAPAWRGAEAPIKLVNPDISPITVSLIMVCGVFLARWSSSRPHPRHIACSRRCEGGSASRCSGPFLPDACGRSPTRSPFTRFAMLASASPSPSVGNTNSLLGIFWGFLLFKELHLAGWKRWLGVLGGAVVMFAGATLLAIAFSSHQAAPGKAAFGIAAALGAGILWGTMYGSPVPQGVSHGHGIPCRSLRSSPSANWRRC